MNVPARLDAILDDVGVGAILKHLETDRRALVIDIDPSGTLILVMIREEWIEREDGESASKPEHYKIFRLGEGKKGRKKKIVGGSGWRFATEDMKSWLVLNTGHDRLLDHEEYP